MRVHFVARCLLFALIAGGAIVSRANAFPAAPLFVADPSMNAVVVYDSTATGTVAPNSIWPRNGANKMDRPVAVAAGLDCIEPGPCRRYLWVLNSGHGSSVTVYRIPLT